MCTSHTSNIPHLISLTRTSHIHTYRYMPRLSLTPESYCEHGTPSCSVRLVSRVACVHAFPDGPDSCPACVAIPVGRVLAPDYCLPVARTGECVTMYIYPFRDINLLLLETDRRPSSECVFLSASAVARIRFSAAHGAQRIPRTAAARLP